MFSIRRAVIQNLHPDHPGKDHNAAGASNGNGSGAGASGGAAQAGAPNESLEKAVDHETPTPAPGEDVLIELRTELESTRTRLAETHDRMLRIAADADNARKRWEKEREDIRRYAISEFARELLPVVDAFDKAMTLIEKTPISGDTHEGKGVAAIVEGVHMVSKVFHESIKKHGIERLPGAGEPFNPEFHNAIARVVDASVSTDTIAEEFVSGYRIGERVLRTALVKVATKD